MNVAVIIIHTWTIVVGVLAESVPQLTWAAIFK